MARAQSEYNRKRNFEQTSEPREEPRKRARKAGALRFVIQKHDARRLHYDFRLELDGTLKSWAVPKGPSLDPRDKRLAVHVEDHPLDYASFEGSIPEGNYGAGDVIVWDHGVWQPHGDPASAYAAGKLKFTLVGEKLAGDWTLVRTHLRGSSDKQQWLLIKERDDTARSADEYDIVEALPQSVISGGLVGGPSKKAVRKAAESKPKTRPKAESANADFPASLAPQLATLMERPPEGDWLYEVKFDGYRILARIADGEVRLFTRNGHDWTARLPRQAEALAKLKLRDTWLDGEVVVMNDQGLPDFQLLQNAFDIGRSHDILYYLFDAPFINGEDLRETPLEQRRAQLKQLLGNPRRSPLRFSEAFSARHEDIIESACAMSLEGVIGKRAGSLYVSRRSSDWIKLKCRLRQEFVIVGHTKPQGSRSGFGALLLAVNDEDGLRYAGRVGSGFGEVALKELHQRLQQLARSGSPLAHKLTSAQTRGVSWVEPQLVGEVEFAEWTREGIVRQATFVALRSDKPASQIVRERPRAPEQLGAKAKPDKPSKKPANGKGGKPVVAEVPISNPQRVIDPDSGTTKLDLALFYEGIAEWLLPYLDNRPVSLVRAPDGVGGEQFFQKHAERLAIPNIKHLDPSLDPGHARLMEIDSLPALVGAVQMGTIELHTWGATSDRIETPDHLVLDLDPDPALPWRSMLEATRLTLAVLNELHLDAYLKTSGGKGIHIIVPLARRAGWDTVKGFAKAVAQFMTRQLPERFTATSGPKNRVGKIFIDYLRNGRGASTVAAYSVRARPGLPVSVPISRDELEGLRSAQQWTIANLQERLDGLQDNPWKGYANRQRLTRAMWERLGATPPASE
ncbi:MULTISPECIES: DNA ligase D [unclassified Pseudomonas]|uniref:DNA ligase D n=1 Tax=unclassified Pseudomonas TaxID=196821 RepID=UPI00244A2806|nr:MULTISPECIES: DNA ligase D [unclassified Pseudomonas]MDG9926347.1 DNA ligase D [Pseudomonas sp. GD04045]MDH0037596.1 DNA ligase D [Pseudomonas sp. GD04019]